MKKSVKSGIKNCAQCQKTFKPLSNVGIYCSKDCRRQAANTQRVVNNLLKQADKTDDQFLKNRYLRQADSKGLLTFCKHCDSEFMKTSIKSVTIYCSSKCKKEADKILYRQRYYRKKAEKEKDPIKKEKYLIQSKLKLQSICDGCHKKFNTAGKRARRFCSEKCRTKKEKETSHTLKKLIQEHEKLKARNINPYFLNRGDVQVRMDTGLTAISGNS